MKNEFELLTQLLLQYPNNPVTAQEFAETVTQEVARLQSHFQNRTTFGENTTAQYDYLSWQTVYMFELNKNLDKVPRPLQVLLVGSLHEMVGIMRDHLKYLAPLQEPKVSKEQEAAEVEQMNEIIRLKEAEIDKRHGDKLDKLKATVEVYSEIYTRKPEVSIEQNTGAESATKVYKRKRAIRIAATILILVAFHVLINICHSYSVRGTISCKGKSTTFLLFAPTTAPGWDWSVCDVPHDTVKVVVIESN